MTRKHTKKSNQHKRYEERNGPQRITYGTLRPIQNNEHLRLLEERKESNARQLDKNFMNQYGNAEPIYRELKGRRLGGSGTGNGTGTGNGAGTGTDTGNGNGNDVDSENENPPYDPANYVSKDDLELYRQGTVKAHSSEITTLSKPLYNMLKGKDFMENIIKMTDTAIYEKNTKILILLVISMIHFIVEKMNTLGFGPVVDVEDVDLSIITINPLTDVDYIAFNTDLQEIRSLLIQTEEKFIYKKCYELLIRMKNKLGV
jgi:hypothetical protein